MPERTLLGQPHLTIVSGEPDFDLQQIAQTITHSVTVCTHAELAVLFGRLIAEAERSTAITPKTLDLIGHTRSSASLLALGEWLIDVTNPTTTAWLRELADHGVLARLGVHALRLLGCNTAGTAQGRDTIGKLADLLGLEVYGTTQLLHAGHYAAGGFRDCWSFLLVAASDLHRARSSSSATPAGGPHPRILDIDALPAVTLGPRADPCPRVVASAQAARQILQLVRHREGARIPGLPIAPTYEVALPSTQAGAYHIAHVLFDGEFLRFYPDGMGATGIVFPVDDTDALRQVVAGLLPAPELNR